MYLLFAGNNNEVEVCSYLVNTNLPSAIDFNYCLLWFYT